MSEFITDKARKMSDAGKRKVFNSLLKRALKRKGISITMLAERINVPAGTVQHWFYGVHIPPAQYGAALSDVLDSPTLEQWLDSIFTYTCKVCKSIFRTEGFSGPRKYCGDDCRRLATKIGKKNMSATATREQELLLIAKRSVAAFCHSCALSPICPNSKCELRAVSPLKTAEDVEIMRPPRRSVKWSDERKQQFSKQMKEKWSDPEEKSRRVELIRLGVASLSEEVRQDRSRKAKENWENLTEEQKAAHAAKSADALKRGREKYQKGMRKARNS